MVYSLFTISLSSLSIPRPSSIDSQVFALTNHLERKFMFSLGPIMKYDVLLQGDVT